MSIKKVLLAGAAGIGLIVGATASPALADIRTYVLTESNLPGYAAPFATVVVDLTSATTAKVTFTSDLVGGDIYLLGGQGSVAVNVSAATWSLGSITGGNAGTGFTPGPYHNAGAGHEDGFGSFNQTIDSFDGYTHAADTIAFTITDVSGTWGSASNVLTEAAAHIFITASPAKATADALITGYADHMVAVPEATTWVMMGLGFAGLGYTAFRRTRKNSIAFPA
jgi:hypothetical protein